MEGAMHYHDLPSWLGLARQLDRCLVGLGAGVAEIDLATEARLRKTLGQAHRGLRVEQVARVHQAADLLAHGRDNARMTVAEAGHGDAAEEVEVLIPILVPQMRSLAAHELDREPCI